MNFIIIHLSTECYWFIQVMMKIENKQKFREQHSFFYIAKLLQYYLFMAEVMNIKLSENFPSREVYIK